MHRTRRWAGLAAGLAVLALSAGGVPARAAQADNLDAALRRNAPSIVKYLRAKGYHEVGVLKFLVARGEGKLSDNVGTLNRSVANRLEVALVLALTDGKVGIVTHASDAV